ncbi:MAG: hypothetical protein ACE1ZQ_02805 [Ignavibacteriaceae bacterium]
MLELLKEYNKTHLNTGLCELVSRMYYENGLYGDLDHQCLIQHIKRNHPRKYSGENYRKLWLETRLYFEPGDVFRRDRYLTNLIEDEKYNEKRSNIRDIVSDAIIIDKNDI